MRQSLPGARVYGAFVLVALVNGLVLWWFHDRYWYPTDEGIYATVAARALAGEVLNLQVQNFHPGYGDFVNAAAFRLFGLELLSLRYPLVAVAFLQACCVFALLRRRGLAVAASGSIAATAIGVVQFLNPTPHWYCLGLVTALAWWLTEIPRDRAVRLVVAGVCLGVLGLLRQLTGVFVAMGLVVVALDELSSNARGRDTWLARALLSGVLGLLVVYLTFSRLEPGAFLLFAALPAAFLVVAVRNNRTSNADAWRVLTRLGLGAVIGVLPLLAYCLVNGSLRAWFDEVVLAALWLPELVDTFDGGAWYAALPVAGLYQAATASSPAHLANGVYWALLPLLAPIAGVTIVRRRLAAGATVDALPVLAVFYALNAMYMQNAMYLYFTAGLSLTAVLWLLADRPARRVLCAAASLFLAGVGISFHAAQPSSRSSLELLRGQRVVTGRSTGTFPRVGLRLDDVEQAPYRELTEIIRATVPVGETILAVPNDAELYFLSDRRNPFRFYNTALGVRDDAALSAVIDHLVREPPRLVVFRPGDKYNNWASGAIMAHVRARYGREDTIGEFELYRPRAPEIARPVSLSEESAGR